MKRPKIEYVLIGIGTISGLINLVAPAMDLFDWVVNFLITVLAFAPFFLAWHQKRHPYLHLFFLIFPAHVLYIELKKLIRLYEILLAGEPLLEHLTFSMRLAVLNQHLYIPGIAILIVYALRQAIMSRSQASTQSLPGHS